MLVCCTTTVQNRIFHPSALCFIHSYLVAARMSSLSHDNALALEFFLRKCLQVFALHAPPILQVVFRMLPGHFLGLCDKSFWVHQLLFPTPTWPTDHAMQREAFSHSLDMPHILESRLRYRKYLLPHLPCLSYQLDKIAIWMTLCPFHG